MANDEVIHVAVAPPPMLEASLITQVAAIINKSVYDTRLLLSGRIPKIVAHYDSREKAEAATEKLTKQGLMAMAWADSELRQRTEIFKAKILKFEETEVLFWDINGQVKTVRVNDIFLILQGRIESSVETETNKTKTKFSLPATLLAGGIPVWSKVSEKVTSQSKEDEDFVRLYDRNSPYPTVEILQHQMDYSFLGNKIAASSVVNFKAMVARFREVFTRAIFDDSLMKLFGANVLSSSDQEDIDINSKLIYSFRLAASEHTPTL